MRIRQKEENEEEEIMWSSSNNSPPAHNYLPNSIEGEEGARVSFVEILNPHRDAEAIPCQM